MNEKKRAVVVGTRFGLRVHVPALRAAGFDVVALVGADVERTQRRAQRAGIAIGAASLQDAISQTSPDVVTIATPPHTHHEMALAAISAGAHVICEKPMAVNGDQAEEMTIAAKEAGVVALIGTEFRWDPPVAACTHAINQGFIGRPNTATAVRSYSILASRDATMPDWWFDRSLGGGWLAANGAHVIDQLQMWMGPISEVCATTKQVVPRTAGTAEDSYEMVFRTANGATGVLQESAAVWGDQVELTVIAGTSGTLSLDQRGCVLREASGATVIPSPWSAPAGLEVPTSSLAWTAREVAAYVGLAQWLRRAIDGEPHPIGPTAATFADGLSVMRVIDAAHESAANHGWVTVRQ